MSNAETRAMEDAVNSLGRAISALQRRCDRDDARYYRSFVPDVLLCSLVSMVFSVSMSLALVSRHHTDNDLHNHVPAEARITPAPPINMADEVILPEVSDQ